MNGMKKFWGHLRTITHHRHAVIRHCAKAGILLQGLGHDLSKYGPSEFIPGVRYFSGKHSPTEDERRTQGFSTAWMHHKGRNRHHWEYWTDYDAQAGRYKAVPMPRRFVAEMLCDRIAASKTYNGAAYRDGDALDYLMSRKLKDEMHPSTFVCLERFLTILRDEGEDAMFAALRRWLRESK